MKAIGVIHRSREDRSEFPKASDPQQRIRQLLQVGRSNPTPNLKAVSERIFRLAKEHARAEGQDAKVGVENLVRFEKRIVHPADRYWNGVRRDIEAAGMKPVSLLHDWYLPVHHLEGALYDAMEGKDMRVADCIYPVFQSHIKDMRGTTPSLYSVYADLADALSMRRTLMMLQIAREHKADAVMGGRHVEQVETLGVVRKALGTTNSPRYASEELEKNPDLKPLAEFVRKPAGLAALKKMCEDVRGFEPEYAYAPSKEGSVRRTKISEAVRDIKAYLQKLGVVEKFEEAAKADHAVRQSAKSAPLNPLRAAQLPPHPARR